MAWGDVVPGKNKLFYLEGCRAGPCPAPSWSSTDWLHAADGGKRKAFPPSELLWVRLAVPHTPGVAWWCPSRCHPALRRHPPPAARVVVFLNEVYSRKETVTQIPVRDKPAEGLAEVVPHLKLTPGHRGLLLGMH